MRIAVTLEAETERLLRRAMAELIGDRHCQSFGPAGLCNSGEGAFEHLDLLGYRGDRRAVGSTETDRNVGTAPE